ncbi:piwi domain-containing protein [Ditylenchus destructor]|nr:piwi domain-containing protein [Ditylenchus destructor]
MSSPEGKNIALSSVFPMGIKPGAVVYRYDVDIVRSDKKFYLTKRGADDGQKTLNRKMCASLIATLYEKTGFHYNHRIQYVYDERKNLFTNAEIELEQSIVQIEPEEMEDFVRVTLRDSPVVIKIVPSSTFKLPLSLVDSSLCSSPDKQSDHSLRTFLELLTTQPLLNSGAYNNGGIGKLFEKKPIAHLPGGIATHAGIAKGIRIIQNNGEPTPALVTDVRTCAFYREQTLDRSIKEMIPRDGKLTPEFWRKILTLYKGVRCTLTYDQSRSIVIGSLTPQRLAEIEIRLAGSSTNVSLVDFYANNKDVEIPAEQLYWPAVRAASSANSVFPVNVLQIMPNQRVPIEKMSESISAALMKANATDPKSRYEAIERTVKGIATGGSGEFLKAFGVRIPGGFNAVKFNLRQAPRIQFGHKEIMPVKGQFDKSGLKMHRPAKSVDRWIIAHSSSDMVLRNVENWAQQIVRMAAQKGLELSSPELKVVDMQDITKAFPEIVESQFEYVVYIDNKFNKSHEMLKLMEARYKQVPTQHLTAEALLKGGSSTYSNIVAKMNMKLGGMNYVPRVEKLAHRFELDSEKILVVGYDVAHTSKTSQARPEIRKNPTTGEMEKVEPPLDPSVVGICANYLEDPHAFAGDFFYQNAREETVNETTLKSKMHWILTRLAQNRPNSAKPPLIVVVRDGVSEGEFAMTLEKELPALKRACYEYDPDYKPHFVFLVVNKRHQKRFFLKRTHGNTEPGTVIDTKITRPDIMEFFLQSHLPLKGTVKIPQYSVLKCEINVTKDEIQGFMNALCHSHQIINSAVSIPAPVFQAHELAKRGMANFKAYIKKYQVKRPVSVEDHDQLTERLGYGRSSMRDIRFTA